MSASRARSKRRASHPAPVEPSPATASLQDPWCTECRTGDYLVFDWVTPRIEACSLACTTWDVEYWCSRCDGYFGHETGRLPEGIHFGSAMATDPTYVHCGQAMQPEDFWPRAGCDAALPPAGLDAQSGPDAQRWRCGCGFELAVPDLEEAG